MALLLFQKHAMTNQMTTLVVQLDAQALILSTYAIRQLPFRHFQTQSAHSNAKMGK